MSYSEGHGNIIPSPLTASTLPKAYHGCRCSCHTTPGVKHVINCCGPSFKHKHQGVKKVLLKKSRAVGPTPEILNNMGRTDG